MPHGVYRRILDLAGCIVYHLGMVGENESRKGDLTRREFLTGAAVTAAGAVLTACKPGPIAEKAIKEAQVTATSRAAVAEAIKEEGEKRRATLVAPFKKATEAADLVRQERQALDKGIREELVNNGWQRERLIEVRPVGGEQNPSDLIGRIVTADRGAHVRWLPVESEARETEIKKLRKPDGNPAGGLEQGMPIRGIQFEIEMQEPEKGGIRSLWYALRTDRLRERSFIVFPPEAKVLKVTDENRMSYEYVFVCAKMGNDWFITKSTTP